MQIGFILFLLQKFIYNDIISGTFDTKEILHFFLELPQYFFLELPQYYTYQKLYLGLVAL
jgi:hypothetical protein